MKVIITKRLAFLVALSIIALMGMAQAPLGFTYQAVVRNGVGTPITDKTVGLRITLQNTSEVAYYTETHTPTSNAQGVISVIIGKGNQVGVKTFASIPWEKGEVFVKAEIDAAGGTNYIAMGTATKIQSVPYALYAENTKEIVSLPNATDDDPIFVVKNKAGQVVFAVYQSGVRVYVEDSQITKGARGGFAIGGLTNQAKGQQEYFRITPDSARIYVKEVPTQKGVRGGFAIGGLTNQGKTTTSRNLMFVAPDSTRIYIDNSTTPKGARGGFAIGGLTNQAKGETPKYFRITPDSARIYINEISKGKGARGGFAIGGLTNQAKGTTSRDLMFVAPDSTRIYIDDSTTPKGARGGFAIGGLTNQAKGGGSANFFNVSTTSTNIIYPSQKRVMWYPLKNAFLAGQVIIEKPDSVGLNSFATGFESKAKGGYSQAFGYQAIARGLYSTAIGYQAVAHKNNSFAFGYQAKATSLDSYAFGSGAEASGNKSFAFGSVGVDSIGLLTGIPTGNTKATGDYAFAFGQGSLASGKASIAFGANNTSSGSFSTAIGYKTSSGSWYSTAMGGLTIASGPYSVAMGFKSTASGVAGCAFGYQSTASGIYSFACGDGAKAIGARSIAIGAYSKAQGAYSFAVGYSSITGLSATAATALGRETNASASNSTAFGYQSTASGMYSLAGGNVSMAGGLSSIALGDHANASADYSVALGRNVTASTQYAIAIGNATTASGDNSTAFGNQTSAVGKYSLAAGYGCAANAYASTVVGTWNVVEGTPGSLILSDPIFVVGNGTTSTNLSNAVTVYKDGTMKLKSNFYPESATATLGTSGSKWNMVYATNGVINTSDIRLKDNITEIAYGLTDILKLKPVSFFWKNNPQEGRKLGFIAQDVKPIINEVVTEGDDPDKTLGMNYSSIIPIIVKGMQEQQQQIDRQRQQIEDLTAANKKLLELIEKLETQKKQ